MRIMVGMSGGVDSAVAAWTLVQQGHDAVGVFMRNWEEQDDDGLCTATQDYDDMRRCCDAIGIPYYTVNFSQAYLDRVFAGFLHEYQAGRTPNPDVLCNKEIKFDAFLDYMDVMDAARMATGHYARLKHTADGIALLRGADEGKDQSYFLCQLNQRQLQRVLFPVGHMHKQAVREAARRAGLPVADKRDSTGICFIGERRFVQFISEHIPSAPGDIVDIDSGSVLGRHDGLFRHTIGQRKGLGIGGAGEAWFAARKDAASNTLYIAQGQTHPALYATDLLTEDFHWISGQAPQLPMRCTAKLRYRQPDAAVYAEQADEGLRLRFDDPQRAVTPGQYAVLYDGEACLGGGVIQDEGWLSI